MLEELFTRAQIPTGRILFLHSRLKNIHNVTGLDYLEITRQIIHLLRQLQPKALLIPAYTIYSFMRSGVYHRLFSKSEVGRFSEEVHQHFDAWRSPDPMYGVLDLTGYLPSLQWIDYTRTFGENSLFQHLLEQDEVIINLDLCGTLSTDTQQTELYNPVPYHFERDFSGALSTHVHQAELANQVPYRFERSISGVVYHDETRWERINYHAYLRPTNSDGGSYPHYDRKARLRYLLEHDVIRQTIYAGMGLSWFTAQPFVAAINAALEKDKTFLVVK